MATSSDSATTLPSSEIAAREPGERKPPAGTGPWRLAGRRLRRNKVALAFGALFFLLVALALLAPLFADQVAKTAPNTNHLSDTIQVDGQTVNVVEFDGVPIGPQFLDAGGKYMLGADGNGRDVMVRLLYGARNSLFIGLTASLITVVLAIIFGLLAGYFRG
jgi:peptide/nickel transport system permease protein